jgi:hypothetical protein
VSMAWRRACTSHLSFFSALVAAVLSLAAAGCGSDEEPPAKEPPARGETTGSGPTASAPSATRPPSDAEPPPGGPEHRRESPESQPGGAGDEDGARSPAMFTGRNGKITPKVVRVPPYLAIAAELRSGDGRNYTIRFGKQVLRSGRTLELDGLRPGQRLSGSEGVSIEASAEPGP